jgi:molecular chaperone IbpA
MKVTGATLENGLLTVELRREVPEALKPRRIDIETSGGRTVVSQDNRREQIEQTSKAA